MERGGWVLEIVEEKRERVKEGGEGDGKKKRNRKRWR